LYFLLGDNADIVDERSEFEEQEDDDDDDDEIEREAGDTRGGI